MGISLPLSLENMIIFRHNLSTDFCDLQKNAFPTSLAVAITHNSPITHFVSKKKKKVLRSTENPISLKSTKAALRP